MSSNREQMLSSYRKKCNSSRVLNALVVKQNALFAENTSFVCDCFKSIKKWKTIDLGFVKHEYSILELVEHPESKEEKLSHHLHEK